MLSRARGSCEVCAPLDRIYAEWLAAWMLCIPGMGVAAATFRENGAPARRGPASAKGPHVTLAPV